MQPLCFGGIARIGDPWEMNRAGKFVMAFAVIVTWVRIVACAHSRMPEMPVPIGSAAYFRVEV